MAVKAQNPNIGHWPSVVLQSGKAGRMADASRNADSELPQIVVNPGDRFERIAARASLTPSKIADLFEHPALVKMPVVKEAPLRERFDVQAKAGHADPVAERFGPGVAEPTRASRLALALSGAGQVELASFAPSTSPLVSRPAGVYLAPPEVLEASLETDIPGADGFPDAAPLPTSRPELAEARRAAAPSVAAMETASPPQRENVKAAEKPVHDRRDGTPNRSPRSSGEALAYAKPDNPVSDLGQAFKNLFSPKPRRNGGVAIYDISAQTVYMPDGTRLEAHSGLGAMVDDPRYVRVKNRGPTPPNTYNLTMRESRFHGVEAIRLTPVDGHNKYGRDGLLAHTYMLRGGREESNGCVVFQHYERFLDAFKKGKIKQLVVVPGNGRARTRVASYGRGA
jgi:hypothetical protein